MKNYYFILFKFLLKLTFAHYEMMSFLGSVARRSDSGVMVLTETLPPPPAAHSTVATVPLLV